MWVRIETSGVLSEHPIHGGNNFSSDVTLLLASFFLQVI